MASEIRVNQLTNRSGLSTITFANGGVQFSGITTFANGEFYVGTGSTIVNPSANTLEFHTGGSSRLTITNSGVNIPGVLTQEDVTNIDSVGIVTARSDIHIGDKIVHIGDTNTAIRFPAADTITAETAGSERLRIDSSGRLLIGTTTEGYASADDLTVATTGNTGITIRSSTGGLGTLAFSDGTTGAAEYDGYIQYSQADQYMDFGGAGGNVRLRITSAGKLLIASTSSRSVWGANPELQIEKLDSNAALSIIRNSNTNAGPWLALCKSRGTSNGAVTIVQDGDSLGSINWFAADGVDLANTSAEIRAEIDGTPGNNDLPGRIIFKTTADGAASPTERLRIESNGKIAIGNHSGATHDIHIKHATSPGIKIQDTTQDSTLLLFAQDSSTGIGNFSNHAVQIYSNSLSRIQLTNDGKLQIGLPGSSSSLPGAVDSVSIRARDEGNLHIRDIGNLTSPPSGSGVGIDVLNNASNTVKDLCIRGATTIFRNASAETFRITSSGDFGFGTSSPTTQSGRVVHFHAGSAQQRLHMTNNTTGSGATDGFEIIVEQSANVRIRNFEAGALMFDTGGSNNEAMRITSAGKVLIGTTTPQGNANADDLTVYSNGNSGITIRSATSSNGNLFFADGISGGDEYRGWVTYDHSNNRLTFGTNAAERLVISSTGNFGVGTNNPLTKAHIHGGDETLFITGDTAATSAANTGGIIALGGIYDNSGNITGWSQIKGLKDNNTSGNYAGYLSFTTRDQSAGYVERLRINSSGNMGLGDLSNVSNNPQTLLHIANTSPTFRIQDTTNDFYAHISADDGGNLILDGDAGNGAGSSYISLRTDGTERVRITNGNVIRCYSPDGNSKGYIYQTNSDNFIVEADTSNSIDGDLLLRAVADGGTIQMVCGGNNERLRITSAGTAEFYGGEGGTDAIKVQSEGGGAGLYFSNFQGITDTGDSTRLGVGKNDNALIWMNASGSQVGCLAYGTTDAVPLVFSTHNTERLRVAASGAFGLSGANYGSSGQVLTSAGSGSAPTWTTVSGGVTSDSDNNTVGGTNAGNEGTWSGASDNTCFGSNAGTDLTNADGNTLIGKGAGENFTSGGLNTAIGYIALRDATTQICNTAVGAYALQQCTRNENTAVGYQAGKNATNIIDTTLMGYRAGYSLTDGEYNTFIGWQAGESMQTGNRNTAVGRGALDNCVSGHNNTCLGLDAGMNTTASDNIMIGTNAGRTNTTGNSNVYIGTYVADQGTDGSRNVCVGMYAMSSGVSSYNTLIGWAAGHSITSNGNYNTCLGYGAGYHISSGTRNTCIGHEAGYNQLSTDSNELWIARGATGPGSTAVYIYGDGSGNVIRAGNGTSWSQTSDRRIKKNIVDNTVGLDIINKIRIRNFEYRTEDEIDRTEFGGSTDDKKYTAEEASEHPDINEGDYYKKFGIDKTGVQLGVIAQELEEVLPNMVTTNSTTSKKTTNTDELIWHLVNAVKELSAENTAMKARLDALESS